MFHIYGPHGPTLLSNGRKYLHLPSTPRLTQYSDDHRGSGTMDWRLHGQDDSPKHQIHQPIAKGSRRMEAAHSRPKQHQSLPHHAFHVSPNPSKCEMTCPDCLIATWADRFLTRSTSLSVMPVVFRGTSERFVRLLIV